MKQVEDIKNEIRNALMDTGLVRMVNESCTESRSIDVHFYAAVPNIKIYCDYDGTYSCYGGLYHRIAKWKDVKSALKSIKRKHDEHVKAKEGADATSRRRAKEDERKRALMARAEAEFGGRAKCIVGPFGGTFSIRGSFDEEQVMKFLEHNKEFIDDDGHWTL